MARTHQALLLAALALAGCAGAMPIPEPTRQELAREWDDRMVHLRTSLNVMPFFGDPTRRLASQYPADAVVLDEPSGMRLVAGPVEGRIPLGTKVRVESVEFPTGFQAARRPAGTPRAHPWIELSVPGSADSRPLVVVLPRRLGSREEFQAAMKELFTEDDPAIWLRDAGPELRRALEEKRLLEGMDARAVLTAWGRPERMRQELQEGTRVETWTWPGDASRVAVFRDGRLIAAEPPIARAER